MFYFPKRKLMQQIYVKTHLMSFIYIKCFPLPFKVHQVTGQTFFNKPQQTKKVDWTVIFHKFVFVMPRLHSISEHQLQGFAKGPV